MTDPELEEIYSACEEWWPRWMAGKMGALRHRLGDLPQQEVYAAFRQFADETLGVGNRTVYPDFADIRARATKSLGDDDRRFTWTAADESAWAHYHAAMIRFGSSEACSVKQFAVRELGKPRGPHDDEREATIERMKAEAKSDGRRLMTPQEIDEFYRELCQWQDDAKRRARELAASPMGN